jgi:hypothetical protein
MIGQWNVIRVGIGSALVGILALVAACGGGSQGSLDGTNTTSDPTLQAQQEANIQQGQQSVMTRKCVDCHTMAMSGSTTAIPYAADPTVELYPPNLTSDMVTGVGTWTDEELARAIREGEDNDGLELCPEMNHFSTMSDYEVYSIVKYLRSLPSVNNKVLRSVCPPLKTKAEQQAAL